MKKCPFCAEEIQEDAIKCRYCNEFISNENKPGKAKQVLADNFSKVFQKSKDKFMDVYGSNMSLPTDRHPFKIKNLSLYSTVFTYKDIKYSYTDVRHITLLNTHHSSWNLPIGATVTLYIKMTDDNNSMIKVSQIFHPLYPRKNRLIKNIYLVMSTFSKEKRISQYFSNNSKSSVINYYANYKSNQLVQINTNTNYMRYGNKNFKINKNSLEIGLRRGNSRTGSFDPREITLYDGKRNIFSSKIRFRVFWDDDIILPLISNLAKK